MSKTLNIDGAIKSIKSIVDSLRCRLCDKVDGARLRFGCGHVACEECVATTGCCLFCLTPPGASHAEPVADHPLGKRVVNAVALLNSFQALFHVDVEKHHRLSEQLKVEKEIFPDCIQAPTKYSNFNKRASKISLKKNINNSQNSIYPGELIMEGKRMNKYGYIKQWLDNQDHSKENSPRRPFADLNVNSPRIKSVKTSIKTRADLILDKVKDNAKVAKPTKTYKASRKKSNLKKPALTHKKIDLNKIEYPRDTAMFNFSDKHLLGKNEKEESGIEIDSTIVIDETQSEVLDKDKLACLAVMEAEKKQHDSASVLEFDYTTTKNPINSHKLDTKVPFYKKGKLFELCEQCNANKPKKEMGDNFKPVSITIENESFKTTITVTKDVNTGQPTKKCVSIQTDDEDIWNILDQSNKQLPIPDNILPASQDLFTDDMKCLTKDLIAEQKLSKNVEMEEKNTNKGMVVLDSDSESNEGGPLKVAAVVHRSCEEIDYGVLAEMDSSIPNRCLKRPRGLTPTSTDSSDKENYDPNRQRRKWLGKKKSKCH